MMLIYLSKELYNSNKYKILFLFLFVKSYFSTRETGWTKFDSIYDASSSVIVEWVDGDSAVK